MIIWISYEGHICVIVIWLSFFTVFVVVLPLYGEINIIKSKFKILGASLVLPLKFPSQNGNVIDMCIT